MWDRIKHGFQELKNDAPGERFVNAHHRWHVHTQGYFATVCIVVLALVLIAGGGFLGFVPGAPGVVLVILGCALIGTRFRRVAIWLDWIELKLRKTWRRLRRSQAAHLI